VIPSRARYALVPYTTLIRSLGDCMVVIERGRVVQEGTPAEVAGRPRTEYVARLVGLNLLRATATGRVAEVSRSGDGAADGTASIDRKSTRLNSSHVKISYAV